MPYRLLLADDSITIQRVIELTFADEDVTVISVADGQEAVRRIVADPPDIILADVDLPRRDGYDITSFVKNDTELSRIPVLLLTGAFEPIDEARAQAVRCDGILSKPFDPQVLIARVRELLGRPPAPSGDMAGRGRPAGEELAAVEPAAPPEDLPLELSSLDYREAAPASPETSLDDYFDRLDAAFAHLTSTPPVHDAAIAVPPAPAVPGGRVSHNPGAGSGVPVSEAFAALLDAEQTFGSEGAGDAPAVRAVASPVLPEIDDAFIEDVARRVADRLGETALRAAVAEIVSATAERLIREEIERIKGSIQ